MYPIFLLLEMSFLSLRELDNHEDQLILQIRIFEEN